MAELLYRSAYIVQGREHRINSLATHEINVGAEADSGRGQRQRSFALKDLITRQAINNYP